MQLLNRLEALLEEAHIQVSSVVSDRVGTSARRMRATDFRPWLINAA